MKPKMTTLFKCLIGAAVCAFSTQVLHAEDTKLPYWKDIQTVAVNKEYPRTAFMTYDNRNQALTGEYENSPYYKLLNGTWNFYYADAYKDLPANIEQPDANIAWKEIKVPGNWEVQGYGVAIYTNHGYEFKPRNPQPPQLPETNPVGVYQRDIEIPADWDGFTVHYRYHETVYHIVVRQISGGSGALSVVLDGVDQPTGDILLSDDRREHSVEVRIPIVRV